MDLGKLENGKLLITNTNGLILNTVNWLFGDGYKKLEYSPRPELSPLETLAETYDETEDKITVRYNVVPPSLDALRGAKLAEIDAYDKSSAVNSFSIGGLPMWLDKETRSGLGEDFRREKEAGAKTTKLWSPDPPYQSFDLDIDAAIGMLNALCSYAKICFNITKQHKANVSALTTTEEILGYDITTGYPDKLTF